MQEVKVSICSQVINRLHQLEKTWERNRVAIENGDNVEWVIADMGSTDGLWEFMKDKTSDKIHYFRATEILPYSIPISKNIAARLSSGDYVFNLDIDNFVDDIEEQIRANNYGGVCCNTFRMGVFGRIGCPKRDFISIGGYDESLLPAAQHEQDLMARGRLAGVDFKNIGHKSKPIQNTKEETTKNMKGLPPWEEMNNINTIKSKQNQANKVVNPNKTHRKGLFIHNFERTVALGSSF